MAIGRTIGAKLLTTTDLSALAQAQAISELVANAINDTSRQDDYFKQYGKVHQSSRDAGAGLGGGKVQRDALVTRGVTNKAPLSNRNLRWHPLVTSSAENIGIPMVEDLRIADGQILEFQIRDDDGEKVWFSSENTYLIPTRHAVPNSLWELMKDDLRGWNDTDWTRNSCVIKVEEACNIQEAIEVFGVLSVSIAVANYGASSNLLDDVASLIVKMRGVLSGTFPTYSDQLLFCPLCRLPLNDDLSQFRVGERGSTWTPNWTTSKRNEGNDASLQVMHVDPLKETSMRHHA